MTKENWVLHLEKSESLIRPSLGGNKENWTTAMVTHLNRKCTECLARKKTKLANTGGK